MEINQEQLEQSFEELKDEIFHSLSLSEKAATGFYPVYCPICNYTKKKKGGFKFENDSIVYHCFRGKCDASCVYTLGEPVSRKFRHLMESINVDVPLTLKTSGFHKKNELFNEQNSLFKKNEYKNMSFPSSEVVKLDKDKHPFWWEHLENRKVIYNNFFVFTKGMYKGSLMIPMYLYNKLIGYEVVNTKMETYTITDNQHIIFCPEGKVSSKMLLVEGTFDALCFPNTVATKNAKLTPEQAYHLRRCEDVVCLPDKTGSHLLDTAKDFHWSACVPLWEEKDLSEYVRSHGYFNALESILESTTSDLFIAETRYRLW